MNVSDIHVLLAWVVCVSHERGELHLALLLTTSMDCFAAGRFQGMISEQVHVEGRCA